MFENLPWTTETAIGHSPSPRALPSYGGRYVRQDGSEHTCQTIGMSPDYIAVHAGRAPEIAEKVVLLLDEFGRFDGKVVLCFRTGFTMNFEAEGRRRERVATQLAWLSRRHTLEGAAQLRRHERIVPFRSDSTIAAGDEVFPCQIKNMSRGGALLATPGKARNGAKLTIGRNTRAEVVRQTEDGFAVVFMRLLPLETFDWHLEL